MPESPIRTSGESRQFRRFRLDCALLTAPGRGRAVNEDRCLFAAPGEPEAERADAGYLFCVADGEADGKSGRSAANETVNSILEILEDDRRTRLRPDLLSLRMHDANFRVTEFIQRRCAASAVWIWEGNGADLDVAWAHIGNTRLYHRRLQGGWRQVTRDHAKGRLLDRAIGGGVGMEIDSGTLALRPGEGLVLVTTGVWRSATPGNALAGIANPTAAETVRRLVGQARLNGSAEDTSALAIHAGEFGADPEPEH